MPVTIRNSPPLVHYAGRISTWHKKMPHEKRWAQKKSTLLGQEQGGSAWV